MEPHFCQGVVVGGRGTYNTRSQRQMWRRLEISACLRWEHLTPASALLATKTKLGTAQIQEGYFFKFPGTFLTSLAFAEGFQVRLNTWHILYGAPKRISLAYEKKRRRSMRHGGVY